MALHGKVGIPSWACGAAQHHIFFICLFAILQMTLVITIIIFC